MTQPSFRCGSGTSENPVSTKLTRSQTCRLPLLRTSNEGSSVDFATYLCWVRPYEDIKPTFYPCNHMFMSVPPKMGVST